MDTSSQNILQRFDRLEQILCRTRPFGGMNLEQLDGFIAALVCTPGDYSIIDYMPFVMGLTAHPDIFPTDEWDEFMDLLLELQKHRMDSLSKKDMELILKSNKQGNVTGQDWGMGFALYSRIERGWNVIKEEEDSFWQTLGIIYTLWTGTTLPEDMNDAVPLTSAEIAGCVASLEPAIRSIFVYLYTNRIQAVEPADADTIWNGLMKSHYIATNGVVH